MSDLLRRLIIVNQIILSIALGWVANDIYRSAVPDESERQTSGAIEDENADSLHGKAQSRQELVEEILRLSPTCVRDSAASMAQSYGTPVTETILYKAEAKCLMESQEHDAEAAPASTSASAPTQSTSAAAPSSKGQAASAHNRKD